MVLEAGTRRLVRTRAAVLLTTAVAVLSLATGLANITVRQAGGPLAPFIPPSVQQVAGFTGAVTGFLLLVSTWGLRRGYRTAWYSTVALLPITAAQGLVQASVFSLPLVALSLLSLPTVLVNYRQFDREVSLSSSSS